MVLRAKMVAQSFTVDWLSNAPCVSSRRTATWEGGREGGREEGKEGGLVVIFPCKSTHHQEIVC